MSKIVTLNEDFCIAIHNREPFKDPAILAYRTKGGTYVIATPGHWTHDGKPRDLVAIYPNGQLEWAAVALRPTVDPEFFAAIEREVALGNQRDRRNREMAEILKSRAALAARKEMF